MRRAHVNMPCECNVRTHNPQVGPVLVVLYHADRWAAAQEHHSCHWFVICVLFFSNIKAGSQWKHLTDEWKFQHLLQWPFWGWSFTLFLGPYWSTLIPVGYWNKILWSLPHPLLGHWALGSPDLCQCPASCGWSASVVPWAWRHWWYWLTSWYPVTLRTLCIVTYTASMYHCRLSWS